MHLAYKAVEGACVELAWERAAAVLKLLCQLLSTTNTGNGKVGNEIRVEKMNEGFKKKSRGRSRGSLG